MCFRLVFKNVKNSVIDGSDNANTTEQTEQNIDIFDQMELNTESHTHYVLQKLLETVNQNASRSKAGYRFDPEVRKWAGCIKMLAGPKGYVTLQKNLNLAFPSLSRINHFVQRTNYTLVEGVLHCDELKLYLEERDLGFIVSLSEDATRIQNRIQYDSKNNQLVGFVLPIDKN